MFRLWKPIVVILYICVGGQITGSQKQSAVAGLSNDNRQLGRFEVGYPSRVLRLEKKS